MIICCCPSGSPPPNGGTNCFFVSNCDGSVSGATVSGTEVGGTGRSFSGTTDGTGKVCLQGWTTSGSFSVTYTKSGLTKTQTVTIGVVGIGATVDYFFSLPNRLKVTVWSLCDAAGIAGATVSLSGVGSATTNGVGVATVNFSSTPPATVSMTVTTPHGQSRTVTGVSTTACTGPTVNFYDHVCINVHGCPDGTGSVLPGATVNLTYNGGTVVSGTTDGSGNICGYPTVDIPDCCGASNLPGGSSPDTDSPQTWALTVSAPDYTTISVDPTTGLSAPNSFGPCGGVIYLLLGAGRSCCNTFGDCPDKSLPGALTFTDSNGAHSVSGSCGGTLCYTITNPNPCPPANQSLGSTCTPLNQTTAVRYILQTWQSLGLGGTGWRLTQYFAPDEACFDFDVHGTPTNPHPALRCVNCSYNWGGGSGPVYGHAIDLADDCTRPLNLVFNLQNPFTWATSIGGVTVTWTLANPAGSTLTVTS